MGDFPVNRIVALDGDKLAREISDREFGIELRRGLIIIARALAKRYQCQWLLVIFGEVSHK